MERASAQADVQQLLEQLYDKLDAPDLNRNRVSMRETLDHLAHSCMVHVEPEVSDVVTEMMDRGLQCQHARLTALLLSRRGGTFSFDQCLEAISVGGFKKHKTTSTNRLRVTVSQLRSKLQKKRIPLWIECVWGLGYRMIPRKLDEIPCNGIGGRTSNAKPQRMWQWDGDEYGAVPKKILEKLTA